MTAGGRKADSLVGSRVLGSSGLYCDLQRSELMASRRGGYPEPQGTAEGAL